MQNKTPLMKYINFRKSMLHCLNSMYNIIMLFNRLHYPVCIPFVHLMRKDSTYGGTCTLFPPCTVALSSNKILGAIYTMYMYMYVAITLYA